MSAVKNYIFYTSDNCKETKANLEKFVELSKSYLSNYLLINLNEDDFPSLISKKSALIIFGEIQDIYKVLEKKSLIIHDFAFRFQIDDSTKDNIIDYFKKVSSNRIIIDVISAISNLYPPELDEQEKRYLSIDAEKVKEKGRFPCDLYLRIGSEKAVRVFIEGEDIGDRFEQYSKKGIKEYLFLTDDFYTIDNSKLLEIFNFENFIQNPSSNFQKQIDIVHDMARDLGIDEIVFVQMEDTMNKFAKELNDPTVKSLLDEFNSLSGTFLFKHSYLISILCYAVVRRLDWATDDQLGKFGVAAMLHDLGFSKAEYAHYELNDNFEELPNEIKKELKLHSANIANKLMTSKSVHIDIIKMIKLHHNFDLFSEEEQNVADGRLNHQACIFLMTHYFVIQLYKSFFDINKVTSILNELTDKFSRGTFKSITKVFQTEMRKALKVESV